MLVHLLADLPSRVSALRAVLAQRHEVTSELLADARLETRPFEAVVIAVDVARVENISALKAIAGKLARVPKRIFVIDAKGRLSIVQAYALGATEVLTNPVAPARLLGKLAPPPATGTTLAESPQRSVDAASAGAASLASMFAAVMTGNAIDVTGNLATGGKIASCVAEHGLTDWLNTVRQHHEGTYQHCLLVTGIAVDFGLRLGLCKADLERLYSAAIFHDIGKAKIPLAVLDKPGRLDEAERQLIQTHPVAGFEVLKDNPAISPEILDAVRHHHEFLDGSGYPDGLLGNSIGDIVRMLTISDIFAALIEHRSYKATMPREEAYEILHDMNGKLERPLVQVFREVALNR
jgi:putative nucleotidyltransferase with HDIG domain